MTRAAAFTLIVLMLVAPAEGQVNGNASVMFDVLPDTGEAPAAQPASELRARLFVERDDEPTDYLRLRLSAYVDGLLAQRNSRSARDAIFRPQDLYLEFHGNRSDVRVGFSRIVWGRLDEFQPTDVVNPIDLSRFLLEGRSEARLPVGLIRGRLFLPRDVVVEAVMVPVFRSARFDQLDERTSPFNLTVGDVPVAIPVVSLEPQAKWKNVQGGVRVAGTARRIDVGEAIYRGFRGFPVLSIDAARGVTESFPRFTMIAADFETVRGEWGVRGEFAAFLADTLQSPVGAAPIEQSTFEGGVGVDRRAGDYRVAANLLWSRREEHDLSVVFAAERAFSRETRTVRLFGVYNPADGTAFVRGIASFSLRDNVALEGSGGMFTGTSNDTIGRLTNRDFGYVRLRVYF